MNESDVVEFLIDTPEEKLVDVLKRVFEHRVPAPEELNCCDNRFCLATTWRNNNEETGEWESCEFHLVAYPDREQYPGGGPNYGLAQEGACELCGVTVRSNVKHGICPACFEPVYMT